MIVSLRVRDAACGRRIQVSDRAVAADARAVGSPARRARVSIASTIAAWQLRQACLGDLPVARA